MSATSFTFATATEIVFGDGAARSLAERAATLGRRALVVTGGHAARSAWLLDALDARGLAPTPLAVAGEPTVEAVVEGLERARAAQVEVVVALGGGSVIDTGKAIAALLTNGGAPLDYLEVVGRGAPLRHPSAPFIAAPTTAGSGAEVTRNAVLTSTAHRVKVSLRSLHMLPRCALVDPTLTASLPPATTAWTGLDALTQLIEPLCCNAPNPLTDALAAEGIRRAAGALERAVTDGADADARRDMALASLLGGLALANARLGAVHGFAGPLGGRLGAPHAALCACLLPHAFALNLRALRRAQDAAALARFTRVGRLLTGRDDATAEDAAAWLAALARRLPIPSLAELGLSRTDHAEVIADARRSSSMKGNPVELTDDHLHELLERAAAPASSAGAR